MDPITVSTTIARPREEVFDYLIDFANHPEFTDHFLQGWRLTREDSYGRGAGGRFRVKQRLNRFGFGDLTFSEVEAPRLLVAHGRGGKFNRDRTVAVWELEPASGSETRVRLTIETVPALLTDKVMEFLRGTRGFHKRRWGKALRRLRSILEDDEGRGRRATIAGGARKPATGTPLRHPQD
ncbi:MAG: SRPBCC family protein [Solirubrobacterales bacterium]|nr:SRPBCC family protein [Solirubrobacterales bacterium]